MPLKILPSGWKKETRLEVSKVDLPWIYLIICTLGISTIITTGFADDCIRHQPVPSVSVFPFSLAEELFKRREKTLKPSLRDLV